MKYHRPTGTDYPDYPAPPEPTPIMPEQGATACCKEDHEMKYPEEIYHERVKELEAENATLKSLVRGWHYLAVGPDEMGDYYTHKQLIKASEPYASPALVALAGKAEQ